MSVLPFADQNGWFMNKNGSIARNLSRLALLAGAGLLLNACSSSTPEQQVAAPLAPITVSGSYWIELSPVLVAANSFYPTQITVDERIGNSNALACPVRAWAVLRIVDLM